MSTLEKSTVTRRERRVSTLATGPAAPPWSAGRVAGLAGVPLVGALLLGSTVWAVPHIEETLARDAIAAAEARGIEADALDVDFDYRNGSVSGPTSALSGRSAADLEAAVAGVSGVRRVAVALTGPDAPTDVAAPAAPATTTAPASAPAPAPAPAPETTSPGVGTIAVEAAAAVAVDRMVLTGDIAGEAQRRALLDAASMSGRVVEDELTVVADAPGGPASDARVDALAAVLAGIPAGASGSVRLAAERVIVDVTVPDAEAAAAFGALASAAADEGGVQPVLSIDVPVDAGRAARLAEDLAAIGPVYFATSGAELSEAARDRLDDIAAALNEAPGVDVLVVGHTDSGGGAVQNQQLSEARSAAAIDHLVGAGVTADRLIPAGRSQDDPAASNATLSGRQQNRRVTLEIIGAEGSP